VLAFVHGGNAKGLGIAPAGLFAMMMSGFWSFMVPEPAATPERPGGGGRSNAGSGAGGTPARYGGWF